MKKIGPTQTEITDQLIYIQFRITKLLFHNFS